MLDTLVEDAASYSSADTILDRYPIDIRFRNILPDEDCVAVKSTCPVVSILLIANTIFWLVINEAVLSYNLSQSFGVVNMLLCDIVANTISPSFASTVPVSVVPFKTS